LADELLEQASDPAETVGDLARLYLGNILYALELASLSLEQQGKEPDAAFYRAIARKLAEAHGASKKSARDAERREQQQLQQLQQRQQGQKP
jgi:hypothetical protein